ncbi:autotransporter outer membrane beta-barrel domain-containing protein [Bartonella tribocorum]|uniref:Autotransporter outer membrane beta-barrel domain-containing protein n=1 Tax=Bartonella tribocorum TaxID=85701 RepID=A0A2M6UVJ3_9HYPH|nr:autotransporter outer membrane beta-barrel domain-containing protein [Bartonella tribocorum]PIT70114.1 autotransporter outer membrane beta-barrel domain-containing protein [Bartonella tribocorum]
MKKSFLLYTISGVLFYSSTSLSYAAGEVAGTTVDSSSLPSTEDKSDNSPPSTPPSEPGSAAASTSPAVPSTGVSAQAPSAGTSEKAQKTETQAAESQASQKATQSDTVTSTQNLSTKMTETVEENSTDETAKSQEDTPPSSESNPAEVPVSSPDSSDTSVQSTPNSDSEQAEVKEGVKSPAVPTTTQNTTSTQTQSLSTDVSPTTEESTAKSRRRGAPTSPTDSINESAPESLARSSQPEETQSLSDLQPTRTESDSTELKSPESEPTEAESTGSEEEPPVPNASQSISVRPADGQSASPESVEPVPVQSVSAQKVSEESELAEISPIEQPKNPEKIEDIADIRAGIEVDNGGTITLHNKKIQDRDFAIHAEGNNSKIQMNSGTVDAGFIALSVSNGGKIDATDITVTAETVGLLNIEGTINLQDSNVKITGEHEANGIIFRNNLHRTPRKRHTRNAERNANVVQEQSITSNVNLKNTKIFVDHGIAINLSGTSLNGVVSLKNSEIHADILLKNIKNENESTNTLTLVSSHSSLEGRVRTSKDNRTIFDLKEGTKWHVRPNKNAVNNDNVLNDHAQFGLDEKSFSNLSVLHLTDSAIMFEKPVEGRYQTLFIGPNLLQENETAHTAAVYQAEGLAEIYVNTQWDQHSSITKQQTDRLVINGDVLGSTVVHINLQETDKKMTDSSSVWGDQMMSLPLETHGISIIQVSGQANENSFTLAGNYMTMGGQPYKYVLTAYKPGTSHESQNLFGKNNGDFWDFRLQNAYIDKDKKVRALLPQVANYLTLPNALFSAGFADVNNQNTLLDAMRTTVFGAENDKKNNLFFSSYGEKVTLSSNRGPLRYGYDADVDYGALQLGIILAALESKDISTQFGLLGTYGKLAFTPQKMQDSKKTTLDKWSLTAYSGIQHSNGIYVNALLSYGTLKGNITTALVGNAAKLDGTEILNISATLGQKLTTSIKGLVFEPQAQFIYQNLIFDIFSDANGLKVDMGNPHQWLVRFGGRLTKTIMANEENKAVSFYGKMNVIRTFGDGETIKIADTFQLDPTGSSIEGGVGVNAYFSQNIVLNGDISYRQKLQKTGVSGTSVSGGIRYCF